MSKPPKKKTFSKKQSLPFLCGFISQNGLQGTECLESVHHRTGENHPEENFRKLCETSKAVDNCHKTSAQYSAAAIYSPPQIASFRRSKYGYNSA